MGVLRRYCYDYSSGNSTSHPKTVCSPQMLDVKDSTVVASCRFKRFCGQFGNSLLFLLVQNLPYLCWFYTLKVSQVFLCCLLTGYVYINVYIHIIYICVCTYNIYIHSNCFLRARTLVCGLVVSVSSDIVWFLATSPMCSICSTPCPIALYLTDMTGWFWVDMLGNFHHEDR